MPLPYRQLTKLQLNPELLSPEEFARKVRKAINQALPNAHPVIQDVYNILPIGWDRDINQASPIFSDTYTVSQALGLQHRTVMKAAQEVLAALNQSADPVEMQNPALPRNPTFTALRLTEGQLAGVLALVRPGAGTVLYTVLSLYRDIAHAAVQENLLLRAQALKNAFEISVHNANIQKIASEQKIRQTLEQNSIVQEFLNPRTLHAVSSFNFNLANTPSIAAWLQAALRMTYVHLCDQGTQAAHFKQYTLMLLEECLLNKVDVGFIDLSWLDKKEIENLKDINPTLVEQWQAALLEQEQDHPEEWQYPLDVEELLNRPLDDLIAQTVYPSFRAFLNALKPCNNPYHPLAPDPEWETIRKERIK
jgi:hypothetical protein